MFSTSIDTLEQREALIDLFERHFETGQRRRVGAGLDLPSQRRTRRQVVVVRGMRFARRD